MSRSQMSRVETVLSGYRKPRRTRSGWGRATADGRPTERQQQVLDFIRYFRDKTGFSPTHRDIMKAMGFSSLNAVLCHVRSLRRKGFIEMDPYAARSIRIVGETPVYVPDRHVTAVREFLSRLMVGE